MGNMMDTFDLINGSFEFIGSIALLMNVFRLYKDKRIQGMHWASTLYFTSWGIWNIFYYPSLEQWFSFSGGIFLVTVNIIWLGQLSFYSYQNRDIPIIDETTATKLIASIRKL